MLPFTQHSNFPRLLASFAGAILLGALVFIAVAGVSSPQPLIASNVDGTPSFLPVMALDPTATSTATPTPTATPYGIPQVVAEIPLPEAGCPGSAVVNPYTGWLYVANNGNNTLSILDGTQHIITLPTGDPLFASLPSHLSADPASPRVFLTNLHGTGENGPNYQVYQYASLVAQRETDGEAYDILFNPLNNYIYVTDLFGNVGIYDGTTYDKANTIDFESSWLLGLAMDSSNGLVYAANWALGRVFTVDGLEPAGAVQAGWGVESLAVDPLTHYVYAAHSAPNMTYTNNISVMQDQQLVFTAITSYGSHDVAVNPSTGLAYFTNPGTNKVTILSGPRVVANVTVGANPLTVEVNPLTGYVFVANQDDGTVSVLQGTQVVATYDVGPDPQAIAVDAQRNFVYVVNRAPSGAGCSNAAKVTVLQ